MRFALFAFDFLADSAEAEVHVTWRDRFARPIRGQIREGAELEKVVPG